MAQKQRFDPEEIPGLITKAQTGDLVARDELLHRFQRLIATLTNVLITGRPNIRSSYQKTFLRLFGHKGTPLTNIAQMLKKELANFDKEELFHSGQCAVLLAIEKCETNLASTVVYCFKDIIHELIKDGKTDHFELTEAITEDHASTINIDFSIFLDSLAPEEFECAMLILDGEKCSVPTSLVQKLAAYADLSLPE